MTKTVTCFLFLLLVLAVSLGLPTTAARLQGPDDAYEEELLKGRDMLRRRQFDEALKSFKRANEMREKKCAVCYGWMSEAYLGLEAYKNVIDSADKVIELAAGDKTLLLKAYNNKGLALQAQAERKDQKKLQAAEAVFRQGLTLENAAPILRYNLGVTLLQQNRDPEGISELKQYVAADPRGAYIEMARKLIDNPRRARENFAPDFSFTTAEGEYISLDDLHGKVVVLDFWGTWCPPCVASVPDLRSLYKRYSKEPSFMLISVSTDSDEQVWRDFIQKEKMVWPQYRDKDRKIVRAFNIHAFPTYIVIDHEGIVQFQSIGASWQRAASLEDMIKKQVKIVAKSQEVR